ncbi:MAG: ATP synthase subunit I [Gallionellaceae bacterium]|nr:ATP synthase subunit I [Gallionellaceae bacterium]
MQGGLIAIAAVVVWLWQGAEVAGAALYGGSAALANVGLLVWRWRRGRYDYHCDGGRHLRQFHRSSLERFFLVGVVLALGLYGLRLDPLAMLLGFIVGQTAWIISAATLKTD